MQRPSRHRSMQSARLLGMLMGLQLGAVSSFARSATTAATTSLIAGPADSASLLAGRDTVHCVSTSDRLDDTADSALTASRGPRLRPRWRIPTSRALNVKIMDAPSVAGWTPPGVAARARSRPRLEPQPTRRIDYARRRH